MRGDGSRAYSGRYSCCRRRFPHERSGHDQGIQEAVSIPVMAKVRIGHVAEARILQAIEIDYIDESEVLSPADDVYHIDKNQFDVPFVCGAKNLGEALRRIAEGASMIRTKGEPGTGDVIQAVRHMRTMNKQIRELVSLRDDEVYEPPSSWPCRTISPSMCTTTVVCRSSTSLPVAWPLRPMPRS